ncbi:MAG: tetratricopeptide repeat protein [Christensenellales bacterium]
MLKAAGTPMASYYLGCLLYSFERYAEAAKAWEKTVKSLDFAPAYRNLSLAYYDHLDKPALARKSLETARRLMPESGRIFFELTQLYKSLDLPLDERLAPYESDPDPSQRVTIVPCNTRFFNRKGRVRKGESGSRQTPFPYVRGRRGQPHPAPCVAVPSRTCRKRREKRTEILESGLVFPLNYGEEKPTSSTTRPCITRRNHRRGGFGASLCEAVSTKGAPTIHSYWQTLAYRARGEESRAIGLANEMIAIGETKSKTPT